MTATHTNTQRKRERERERKKQLRILDETLLIQLRAPKIKTRFAFPEGKAKACEARKIMLQFEARQS